VPFTRSVGGALPTATLVGQVPKAETGNGERKNQLPFTKRVAGHAAQTYSPDWFERYAAAHPYGQDLTSAAVSPASSNGFRWRDAFLGAAAALAIVALLASSLVFLRSRQRDHLAPAIGS
jgi:hypothetical protein